jgi:hypothetical protein
MWAECKTSAAMPKASRADRAKITQAGRQPEKTTGRRKSCLPAHRIVILLIISCGAKLRERSINSLITPWPPKRQDLGGNGRHEQGGRHTPLQDVPVSD